MKYFLVPKKITYILILLCFTISCGSKEEEQASNNLSEEVIPEDALNRWLNQEPYGEISESRSIVSPRKMRFTIMGEYYYPKWDNLLSVEGKQKAIKMIKTDNYDFDELKKIWKDHRNGYEEDFEIKKLPIEFEYLKGVKKIKKRTFINGFWLKTQDFTGTNLNKFSKIFPIIPSSIGISSQIEHPYNATKFEFSLKILEKKHLFTKDTLLKSIEVYQFVKKIEDFEIDTTKQNLIDL